MIRVRTGARLHFGLLQPAGLEPSAAGVRLFGGVGLMVATPGVQVSATPASSWSAEGPCAERAVELAQRFAATFPPDLIAPHHFIIEHASPDHSGLGTGTQLGLAVGRCLERSAKQTPLPIAELARRVGRGLRSALGLYGFEHGGFLVEGGKKRAEEISPLLVARPFPDNWRVVLILPRQGQGMHGRKELDAFACLEQTKNSASDALCRLVLQGLLPALVEEDCAEFGECLYEFNCRVGEVFASVQGGVYASAWIASLVHRLRLLGIHGVGQSSWGPAVFGIVESEERAQELLKQLRSGSGIDVGALWTTTARNQGAVVTEGYSEISNLKSLDSV